MKRLLVIAGIVAGVSTLSGCGTYAQRPYTPYGYYNSSVAVYAAPPQYVQPSYVPQTVYVQPPAPQPVYAPPVYAQPAYSQPVYARPMYAPPPPAYVAQPPQSYGPPTTYVTQGPGFFRANIAVPPINGSVHINIP